MESCAEIIKGIEGIIIKDGADIYHLSAKNKDGKPVKGL